MCPVCREPMATFEFEGSDIDRCVRCGGTWMDSGEIELLGTFDREALDRMSVALAEARMRGTTRRRCPRCPRHLDEIAIGPEPELVLDRCPWGHGIWFDRGEMLRLIDAFGGSALSPAARFFSGLYKNEAAATGEGDA